MLRLYVCVGRMWRVEEREKGIEVEMHKKLDFWHQKDWNGMFFKRNTREPSKMYI